MERYEHGGDIYGHTNIQLDFSVNTNPLGLPAKVKQALASRMDEFARYPDPKCRQLCAAISGHENIPQDWILCGNGAADLIYRLCYAVKPRKALVCAPTFSEYERALRQAGSQLITFPLMKENDFSLTDEILEQLVADIDMLFLCHPNNPTGRLISPKLMEKIVSKAKKNGILVILDECFLDFTDGESAKKYLKDNPSLIVLKAFTKMYAMAGLRLGYLLASDKALLLKISFAAQCWSVSVPAQIAGTAALSCTDWIDTTRSLLTCERLFLYEGFTKLGITVFPSDANFLLLSSKQPLFKPLKQKGILIRPCENFEGLDHTYYRIGVKTRDENIRLIQSVKEVLYG